MKCRKLVNWAILVSRWFQCIYKMLTYMPGMAYRDANSPALEHGGMQLPFKFQYNMASSSSIRVSMKLLIDTKNQKVLFAEASKPVIDFLFNLLCLPIGTVVKLLSANDMVGSLGNLYQSVENLNQEYMQPFQTKDVLLNPKAPSSSTEISGFLTQNDDSDEDDSEPKLYMCPKCPFQVTYDQTTLCPGRPGYLYCDRRMNNEVCYVGNKKVAEKKGFSNIKAGFVKDVVTFMLMDDLVIQPMSTISSITLLNKFNIKEIGRLQEKVVKMGMKEGIKLLKASLQSKMVLTSVFIKKHKRHRQVPQGFTFIKKRKISRDVSTAKRPWRKKMNATSHCHYSVLVSFMLLSTDTDTGPDTDMSDIDLSIF